MFFTRDQYTQKLNNSLKNKKICFLIGARQIGKTTLLKKFLKDLEKKTENNPVFLPCDPLALKEFESAQELLQYFSLEKNIDFSKVTHLILDEIQVVKNITLFLKDLHDNYPFKIYASGSGSLQIFSGISESLIGRKEIIHMYPFSFQEFLQTENIPKIPLQEATKTSIKHYQKQAEKCLLYGGYPEVLLQKTPQEKIQTLKNLYQTYTQKDIRYYLQQKELHAFDAFYKIISGSVGSLIKIDKFCQKLSISRKKVEEFSFLLENTFLGYFLPPFVQTPEKEVKSHKKIFFLDSGFVNSVWGNFSLSPERKGLLVENFVISEIIKSKPFHMDMFFWRKKSQTEIDLILENNIDGSLTPIEIKSNSTDAIPKAFSSFFDMYGDKVNHAIVLNKDIFKTREINGKTIHFIPYFYASQIYDLN